MIRKVSGKNKKSECVHIKSSNGNMCYSTKKISNALGENFQKNSSSSNYSRQFQDIKVEKERENLNFQSQNNEKYNLPFKLSELKNSLDKSNDTTAGPPGRVAQSVGHLTRKSGVLGSITGLATYFRFSFRFFKKGSCQLLAKVCARSTG